MRRLLVALTLSALTVTACGSGQQGDDTSTQTLTVQAAGGEGELRALRELISAFEDENPDVRVQFVGVPDQGDHIAKLSTAFAGGSPPDVFLLNYRRLGPFVERGVLAPVHLGDLSLDELYAPPVEAFTYDGKLACLPQNVSSSVVYVNLQLFERAGIPVPRRDWTWGDLVGVAERLHAEGFAAFGLEPMVRNVAPFVWTAGGEVVDDTDDPTAMTFDSRQAREALTFLVDLQDYGMDATSRAATPPDELFARGELGMLVDSRRSVPAFRGADGLRFDVRPLPRHDATRPSASLLASDAYSVAKDSDARELAAELALFAVSGPGAEVLAASGRTVPALEALARSDAFLAPSRQPASSDVWLEVVDALRRLPNVPAQDEAEEAADDLLVQLFAGKAGLDETVAAIRRATSSVYGQDR